MDLNRADLTALFGSARVAIGTAVPTEAGWERLSAQVRAAVPGQLGPGRLRSLAAGRLAAGRAMAALGSPGAPGGRPGRRPTWPPGVHGSIAHCVDLAVCAVGPDHGPRIGIDVERVDRSLRADELLSVLCDSAERAVLVARYPRQAALLAHCAKEASFKSLSAADQVGLPLRQLRLVPEPRPLHFTARIGDRRIAAVRLTEVGEHLLAGAVAGN